MSQKQLNFAHRVPQRVVEMLIQHLQQSKAKNYLDTVFRVDLGTQKLDASLVLTLPDRPSPHELRRKAEAERDQAILERDTYRDRLEKLLGYMGSNVKEGWDEVCKVGAVCAYVGRDEAEDYIDNLPACNVGLCGDGVVTPPPRPPCGLCGEPKGSCGMCHITGNAPKE